MPHSGVCSRCSSELLSFFTSAVRFASAAACFFFARGEPLNLVGRAHAHRGNCRLQETPLGPRGRCWGGRGGLREHAPAPPAYRPPAPGAPAAPLPSGGHRPARDFTILSPCPPMGARRPCVELVCISMTPRTPKLLRCRELERKHPVVSGGADCTD
jgi:hypothetical protein